jgi:hypothetical protein
MKAKEYPRALVWKDDLDDGLWSDWIVYLDLGQDKGAYYLGEYEDWGKAMDEANDAVKKRRRVWPHYPRWLIRKRNGRWQIYLRTASEVHAYEDMNFATMEDAFREAEYGGWVI